MGDIGELRGLITTVSFLGAFALLISIMYIPVLNPLDYEQRKQLQVPAYFEAMDLTFFSNTYSFNITFDGGVYFYKCFVLGGWNLRLDAWRNAPFVENQLKFYHYASWWIFDWEFHTFKWFLEETDYGNELSFQELDDAWQKLKIENNETESIGFTMISDQTQLKMWFGWNTTLYSEPSDALINNAMNVLFGITFDKVNTSFNVWNIIGMMLFFQIPNIHPLVNGIIAIPIWITIGYLVLVLITKVIPFLGD